MKLTLGGGIWLEVGSVKNEALILLFKLGPRPVAVSASNRRRRLIFRAS